MLKNSLQALRTPSSTHVLIRVLDGVLVINLEISRTGEIFSRTSLSCLERPIRNPKT
jgi:hypothetical protein